MAGQIIEVDPATLTIALNVRRDVRLDREFVASIKELGVLQPPMVVANADGGYDVVLGQRRTLAAVEAKLKTIPVYLVDKTEADAARVIDQLTENEQRQSLTDMDRVRGYKELALFGISPAQIAKRTATPRARVDAALAVADNETASEALEQFGIDLEQAAAIAEFADDKKAVKRLREAAENRPAQFPHVVAEIRRERAEAAEQARLEEEITASGVTLLPRPAWSTDRVEGYSFLGEPGRLGKQGAPTEKAGPDDVADKALLAARVVQVWRDGGYVLEVQYLVADGHDLPALQYASAIQSESKEEKAARLAREAEWDRLRKEREAREAARLAAQQVRLEWVRTELLQRKTLPDLVPIAALVMLEYFDGGETVQDALLLAGIDVAAWDTEDADDEGIDLLAAVREHLAAHPEFASRFVLAQIVQVGEWSLRDGFGPVYLRQLEAWGYGLSDFERSIAYPAEESAAS